MILPCSSWDSLFLLGELHPVTLSAQHSKAVKPLSFSQPTARLKLPQNFQTLIETESSPDPPRGQSHPGWVQRVCFPTVQPDLGLLPDLSPQKET